MSEPYWSDDGITLYLGDCLDVLREMPDASVDAVVTDPPAAIAFMGRSWDGDRGGRDRWIAWLAERMEQACRVLKPGGHALVWSLPRTSGWTQMALEDAGFEVRDCIVHIFGCLSEDTEILIDGQWEPYRNVKSGSLALAYNSERDEFAWEPVEEVFVYPGYSDTAFRIHGDHTDQLVSREHRCLVERGGAYAFERAEEIARQRQARVPVLEDLPGLLAALPVPDERTSRSQPDMLEGLRELEDGSSEQGTSKRPAESSSGLPGMRQALPAAGSQASRGAAAGVLAAVSRDPGCRPPAGAGPDRPERMDRSLGGVMRGQDDGPGESCVEGGRDLLPQEGELRAGQVRPLSSAVRSDGPQGRLRDGAPAPGGPGDRALPSSSRGRASRQSQSAGQSPCEPDAVRQQPRPQAVRASRFTRPDLARIEPVEYNGLVWCVRVRSGAFVARRNGKVFVTGNSGFPKSLDVSKAIDRARNDRPAILAVTSRLAEIAEARGISRADVDEHMGTSDMGGWWLARLEHRCAVPTWDQWLRLRDLLGAGGELDAEVWRLNGRKGSPGEAWQGAEVLRTEERFNEPSGIVNAGQGSRQPVTRQIKAANSDGAASWQGWGTALKPGQEMWWLVRKPLAGTVAATVLEHGTGALNIAASRVGADLRTNNAGGSSSLQRVSRVEAGYRQTVTTSEGVAAEVAGRWPANLVFTHSAACEVIGSRTIRGDCRSGQDRGERPGGFGDVGADGGSERPNGTLHGDQVAEVFACAPDCPVGELDRQSGVSKSPPVGSVAVKKALIGQVAKGDEAARVSPNGHGDSGGASRFFNTFRYQAKAPTSERPRGEDGTAHETVKSLGLMRHLVRLVTPPGGTVLDLFAGSGATGEACVIEGFPCVLIDDERPHAELIRTRLSKPIQPVLFGTEAS